MSAADTNEQAQAVADWIPVMSAADTSEAQDLVNDGECPKCGEPGIWRDEVNVGVGYIYGPFGCQCGWSEDSRYDSSDGPAPAEADHPGYHVDSRGGLTDKAFLESFPDHLFGPEES